MSEKMTPTDLTELTLIEAARAIRHGDVTSVALTEAFLERIGQVDRKLNSYLTVMADLALCHAQQADEELALKHTTTGGELGPLHGVPVALKDLFETAGVRTTAGSKFFANYLPKMDAFVVQKLKMAGAVILGKTNLHEIALGLTNVNPHYGACRNPWSLDHVPGGSSGGNAAALAARLAPGALGTDTGGSIRVPAALCGVVGLKPTRARVSTRGVIPLSWNLDHVGPMARRVEDCALLLQVIAGWDPEDPYSSMLPLEDYMAELGAGVRGWRIALAEGDYFNKTQPEIVKAVRDAAAVLRDQGAMVETVDFPGLYQAAMANGMMTTADAAVYHNERLLEDPSDFGPDVLQRLSAGQDLPLRDYVQARRTQATLRRQFSRFFERYDALLMPTTPVVAPPINGPDAIEVARLLTRFTAPFNLTGLPAISLPCGWVSSPYGSDQRTIELPIGLQIVGPLWGEARLLRLAYAYQQVTPWHNKLVAI
jgi:aspartyl-tRNA(Asn)/glutamyl-tRNA(Gln) amidotransferase subunit A